MGIIRWFLVNFMWWKIHHMTLEGAKLKLFGVYTSLDGTRYRYFGKRTYYMLTEPKDWSENLRVL